MPRSISMVSASLATAAVALLPGAMGYLQSPPLAPVVGQGMPAPGPPVTLPGSTFASPGGLGMLSKGSGAPAPASIESSSKVKSLSSDPAVVFKREGARFVGQVWLQNTGGNERRVQFKEFVLRATNGSSVYSSKPEAEAKGLILSGLQSIPSFGVAHFAVSGDWGSGDLEAEMLPSTGWLWIAITPQADCDAGPDGKCTRHPDLYLPIAVDDKPAGSGCNATWIFLGPLGAAFVIALGTAFRLGKNLGRQMGGPTWNFQQSWGSNVTIGAGLIGALITLVTFPQHPHWMPREVYNMLQGLFAAIVALAPPVYGLLPRDAPAAGAPGATVAQGYVGMFVAAGALVLWGAFGQVITMGAMIDEFRRGNTLPEGIAVVLEVLAIGLCLLLFVYGIKSLYHTANQLSKPAVAPPPKPTPGNLPAPPLAPIIPAQEWPLL